MKRFLKTLILFSCAIGLMSVGGFLLGGTPLALPAMIAGFGSFVLGLA